MSLRLLLCITLLAVFVANPGHAGGDAKEPTEETSKPQLLERLYLPKFSVTATKRGRAYIVYGYTISLQLADTDDAEAMVHLIPKIQDTMLTYLVKVSHLAPHLLENHAFIRGKLQSLINEAVSETLGDNAITAVVIEKLDKRPV